jgi:anaerobic selenocysteine-containing dehydrogenase
MMHVIVAEGLQDADYVSRHTLGFDALRERLAEYPPSRVAALTGLEEVDVVRLAREYATWRPAAIRTVLGMEKHPAGGMAYRTIACLPALVGAWRDVGGGLMPDTGALVSDALDVDAVSRPDLEDPGSRVINMIQLGRALTDPELSPPVKVLFVYDANPAVTAPNSGRVVAGLKRPDLFTVVHELFMTDTARFADVVLPATSQLEHLDLLFPWGHTYLILNQPAIAPLGEAVSNNELFRRLSRTLGLEDSYLYETDEQLIRSALGSGHPSMAGVTYERLREEGWTPLDLGPDFRPFAEGGFQTPSGLCELYSAQMAEAGLDPLPSYRAPEARPEWPLVLISGKSSLHFLNSSYANLPRHVRSEREPLLDLSEADAADRDLADGDWVRVHNERGSVRARVRVSSRVRPGVAALPFGWWHSPDRPAGANGLTSDGLSDMGGGGDFYSTRVEVEAAP